jgi:hypothetical protein
MPLEVAMEPSSCTEASFSFPSLSHTTRPTTVITSSCDQGLTLVHFSAQLEPCLTQEKPYTP